MKNFNLLGKTLLLILFCVSLTACHKSNEDQNESLTLTGIWHVDKVLYKGQEIKDFDEFKYVIIDNTHFYTLKALDDKDNKIDYCTYTYNPAEKVIHAVYVDNSDAWDMNILSLTKDSLEIEWDEYNDGNMMHIYVSRSTESLTEKKNIISQIVNVFITGHGYMTNRVATENLSAVNFYVGEGKFLNMDIIPNIALGQDTVSQTGTNKEHYIYATKFESVDMGNTSDYKIAGFDKELPEINLKSSRQILKVYQNNNNEDIVIFPYTTNSADDNLNDISRVYTIGNSLSSIHAYFHTHKDFKNKQVIFHWAACRSKI